VVAGFLDEAILACAFLGGSVSVFDLNDLNRPAAEVQVTSGDPLLAMVPTGPEGFVVGSAAGELVELRLAAPAVLFGGPMSGLCDPRCRERLPGAFPSGSVCHLARDSEVAPRRLLAVLSNLELRVWEFCEVQPRRQAGTSPRPSVKLKLTGTWIWPETLPQDGPGHGHRDTTTERGCLELLCSPPMVACFVPAAPGEQVTLIAATTPRSPCLYVYNCVEGALVSRVEACQGLPPVVRLSGAALAPSRGSSSRSSEEASSSPPGLAVGDAEVLVLADGGCMARLLLEDRGARARWVGRSALLPDASIASSAGRPLGVLDACMTGTGRMGTGPGSTCTVVVKGYAALSCYALQG